MEVGDTAGYERLRQSFIAEYEKNGRIAPEPTLLIALLLPADAKQMEVLARAADVAAHANWGPSMQAPRAYCALGLFEYRRGNYDTSLDWLQKCLRYPNNGGPLNPRARLLAAMAHFRLHQADQAQAELARSRRTIDNTFETNWSLHITPTEFQLHWLINRVLLREAIELIEGPSSGP
jgi:tetratricopeptide (TPR) repeat protein